MSSEDTALIRHVAGPGSGREVEVTRSGPLTIGRDPGCGLILDGATVSRRHARLILAGDGLQVELLSSGNPLWVNGSRVERSTLRLWDLVVIGQHVLRVERIGAGGQAVASGRVDGDASLLACLLEVQRLLATEEDQVVTRALDVLLPALPATRLALFELGEDGVLSQGPTAVRGGGDPLMSATFARRVLEHGGGVLLDEASGGDSPDWTATMREQSVRSILGVPVRHGDAVRGALLCDNRDQPGLLDATHLRILDALARSLEHVVERDELRHLAAERMRREAEVAAARQIQEFLAVGTVGEAACGRWSAIYRPALDLAGDMHAMHGGGGATTWLVADVSGKGLPAALVSAMLKAACSRRLREGSPPRELLVGLHHDLAGAMPPTMFFTACAVRIAADGAFSACGVGHPSVLVLRVGGAVERIPASPGMLGLAMADLMAHGVQETSGTLLPGDRVALITDGATEAIAPDGEMLGEDGVCRILAGLAGRPPDDIAAGLEQAVVAWRAGAPAGDDLTIVVGGM